MIVKKWSPHPIARFLYPTIDVIQEIIQILYKQPSEIPVHCTCTTRCINSLYTDNNHNGSGQTLGAHEIAKQSVQLKYNNMWRTAIHIDHIWVALKDILCVPSPIMAAS